MQKGWLQILEALTLIYLLDGRKSYRKSLVEKPLVDIFLIETETSSVPNYKL